MEAPKPPEQRKERNFPTLDLTENTLMTTQPVLVIQSPKTPTLSRKLKAVSLDSDPPKQQTGLEVVSRDVFSMPNTPKRQVRQKLSCDLDETGHMKSMLTPGLNSNLKRFGSNSSISGSQTLKTLPEIMTLQDFSDSGVKVEPVRVKAKGLLERRGSNASLTIDLGSNSSIAEVKPALVRLNTAKSVSNLYMSSLNTEKCCCEKKTEEQVTTPKKCSDCVIYESVPTVPNKCCLTATRCCRRKSLSNENLYVPPCGFCQSGASNECHMTTKHCKGNRKTCYPRQTDVEASQLLSEDFKLHLQNNQYLQTAGNVLSISDLKSACDRLPKLHQEFWAVPLNLQEKCLVSGSQSRNRYRGVLPNEHSRVHLPGPQSYIHANYIKGPDYTETAYIATQGPMAHTCEDFWEMVWTTRSDCIVMLTGLVEKGRSKCELYFPLGRSSEKSVYKVKTTKASDRFTFVQQRYEEVVVEYEELDEVRHGKFEVRCLGKSSLGECEVRKLGLRRGLGEEERIVHHYWYPEWQDHKMANPKQVLQLAEEILRRIDGLHLLNKPKQPNLINGETSPGQKRPKPTEIFKFDGHEKKSKTSSETSVTDETKLPWRTRPVSVTREEKRQTAPVIVHCSAGIGRTGCFLAILNGMQQLRANFNVDVLAILCSLRLNRGGLVQTAEQYELIHRVLGLYADGL